MDKRDCEHCVCLTEVNNEWVCDEASKNIDEVIDCPEGVENTDTVEK